MTNIKKLQFSTFPYLETDKDAKIQKRLHELMEERQSLNSDLDLIKDATRAASKITTGETPTEEEKDSLDELKNNYPAFFDSDEDEEEEPESSPSLLGKIMVAKDYIRKEMKVNIDTARNLQKKFKGKSVATEPDNLGTVEPVSSGKDDTAKPFSSESSSSALASSGSASSALTSSETTSSESSSSVLASSETASSESSSSKKGESSSSGKSESSGSSSQDELFYNPFDDIGAD